MFKDSSYIIIEGGTFIVVNGGIYTASLQAMGMNNIYQTPEPGENHSRGRLHPNFRASHGQVPATEQFSLETDAQQFMEPDVDPSLRSCSVMNFETPVYGSRQVPEYDPYFMPPTASISSGSWDQSRAPSFPMSSYSTKPRYATHPNKLRKRRHRTLPQPEHLQVNAWPTSFHHPVRAPTYPFTAPDRFHGQSAAHIGFEECHCALLKSYL